MPAPKIDHDELQLDVQAYYDAGGNKSEAARARGLKRQTYGDRLAMAEKELGVRLGKVADGRVGQLTAEKMKLPERGHVRRFILTSLQNNTLMLAPGFENLVAYTEHLDELPNGTCELMVGTFSYQKAAYGAKSVKRGSLKGDESEREWYAPEAEDYISDNMVELAPGLVWCGHMNILPTNKNPLTDFDDYNGRKSNIVPHAQLAMESVASMLDEATKFNYTTGTTGQRNYIQKRAGQLAEQRHDYGATLVEVDSEGNWYVRQLEMCEDGTFCDIGPMGTVGSIKVQNGIVLAGWFVEGLNYGDVHAAELDLPVREEIWSSDGLLDQLRPKYQIMNDLFSMRSRSPHEMKDFHRMYEKHADSEETVEEEVHLTADLLVEARRDFCETVVVVSNHDRHLDRWLNEADFRADPPNSKYFCLLQYNKLDAIDEGDKDFNVLEFALRRASCPDDVRFLGRDESFIICKGAENGGVECGLHGDEGPNGARGNTRNLTKLGRPVNKGHDHKATKRLNVWSAGTCSLTFPYMHGPSAHSVSHIVTFDLGTRQLLTMWAGKSRA